ncbi:MAG: HEAT repeat domain-containing protein [Elusimicrobiota bacterium]
MLVSVVLLLSVVAAAQSPAPLTSGDIRISREAAARIEARAVSARNGDEKSFRSFLADLDSADFATRMYALQALGGAGNRSAVQRIAPLLDDPSPFVQGWGSVSILAMWDLAQLTREGPAPTPSRRWIARVCSAVWRRTEPGRLWDACARWTLPSFAPPPERMPIEKDRAYWRNWWRAHHAEYEGMTFEQGRKA